MTYKLTCAVCGTSKEFSGQSVRHISDNARAEGWAINRDNSMQWCPRCAVHHRRGKRRTNVKVKFSV
ncbi:MAG: hypothetical protein ACI4MS_01625 [Candidatus Coproplasma sp.]